MNSTITALYRTGDRRAWVALLSCGHKRTITNEELAREQLYLGKHVPCAQCPARTALRRRETALNALT